MTERRIRQVGECIDSRPLRGTVNPADYSLSWAASINEDSPEYKLAVEDIIKGLEDWDLNDPVAR